MFGLFTSSHGEDFFALFYHVVDVFAVPFSLKNGDTGAGDLGDGGWVELDLHIGKTLIGDWDKNNPTFYERRGVLARPGLLGVVLAVLRECWLRRLLSRVLVFS